MNLKKIHFVSGITVTVFIGLHLFNHIMSIFGAEVHIDTMDQLRPVYRNSLVESILLIAVMVQIISGLKLFFSKRKAASITFEKLQIWTGLYMAFFLVFHVGAVLTGRYFLNLDTNFYFGVAGLNTFPLNIFFIPYYGFAVLSFFGHISAIHYLKMRKEIFNLTVEQQSRIILVIGIVVTFVILFGLTNGFTGYEIPTEYNIMIGK